jgi:hypothetical protein
MLDAIYAAETATVEELKILVEDAEEHVDKYVDIVTNLAKANVNIHDTHDQPDTVTPAVTSPVTPAEATPCRGIILDRKHELRFGQRPITFDLPSMKAYCATVAPSYAAYSQTLVSETRRARPIDR